MSLPSASFKTEVIHLLRHSSGTSFWSVRRNVQGTNLGLKPSLCRSRFQFLLHRTKLCQSSFQVFDNLGGEDGGLGKVIGVRERIICEPEDIEVRFVARH